MTAREHVTRLVADLDRALPSSMELAALTNQAITERDAALFGPIVELGDLRLRYDAWLKKELAA
jgi:hypothetical protein